MKLMFINIITTINIIIIIININSIIIIIIIIIIVIIILAARLLDALRLMPPAAGAPARDLGLGFRV